MPLKRTLNIKDFFHLEEDDLSAIWLKIKINRKKDLILLGMYRQWGHPAAMLDPTSHKTAAQLERFSRIINKLQLINHNVNSVVIGGDVNIDLYPPKKPTSR